MAALNRAVAVAEVAEAAAAVGRHLHFDVPGVGEEAFDVDVARAERRLCFGLRAGEGVVDVGGVVDDAHAAPATAVGRLDEHGRAGWKVREEALRGAQVHRFAQAADHRHAVFGGELAGCSLVAEAFQRGRTRADEDDASRVAGPRQSRILAQEAVAGVQGVAARALRRRDDGLHVQVGACAHAGDQRGIVGAAHVQRAFVVLGMDGHRRNVEFGSGLGDANRDLAAICDEQLHALSLELKRAGGQSKSA